MGEKDYTGERFQAQAPSDQAPAFNPLPDHRDDNSSANPVTSLQRQALHAIQLGWRHPVSGEFHVISAKPPQDIQEAWQNFGGSGALWDDLATSKDALNRVEMLSENLLR
ncbi:MAG: hypothetical protein A2201_12035 [Alicyclobacillus sp. RIFOXYA1_FULL_53_8]|nr:MAG: hypothetical protein A2201_12035 [Alicyclobacillus sp. RIFOXYA1_FULL_53_8]